MKSIAIDNYLRGIQELQNWRKDHQEDTPEEDNILDTLDVLWREMSDEEQEWVNNNCSHKW